MPGQEPKLFLGTDLAELAGHAQENGKFFTAGQGEQILVQIFRKGPAYLVQPDKPADQIGKLDGFPVFGRVEPFLRQMQQGIIQLFPPQLGGEREKHRDQRRCENFIVKGSLVLLGRIFQPGFQQQINILCFFHVFIVCPGVEHGGVLCPIGVFPHQVVGKGGGVVSPVFVQVVHHVQEQAVVICSCICIGSHFFIRHCV